MSLGGFGLVSGGFRWVRVCSGGFRWVRVVPHLSKIIGLIWAGFIFLAENHCLNDI